jgi:cystathionine gamma-synthase
MKKAPVNLRPASLAAGALGWVAEPYKEIIPPIHLATTYERAADGSYPGGKAYARDESPAYDQAEALLGALEGGAEALLFSSGIAAATAVFWALRTGDAVLAPRMMYWGLRKWLTSHGGDWGLRVHFYENGDLAHLGQLLVEVSPQIVWIETPANPTWDIQDIQATADLAHRHGALVVADSTVATPVHTKPLELGADVVMHSATKSLNGHSDVVAGALVASRANEFWDRIRSVRALGGATLGPFEAWLLLRGMRTLYVRVAAASHNASRIAHHYAGHPKLLSVLYPGLESHPGHEIAARQMANGFGAMLSFRFKGGEAAARRFAARLRVFKQATSLGSVESVVEHRASIEGPGTMAPPDLLRLSVGIEDAADLIADIDSAFDDA